MTVGLLSFAGKSAGGALASGWSQFKLGAGGQVSSIDIVPDATLGQVMMARADTYGCYWYDKNAVNPGNAGGLGCWVQMITDQTLPAPNIDIYRHAAGGGWAIRIAPSNTSRFYLFAGGDGKIYRTDNRGTSWTECGALPGGPYYVSANDGTSKLSSYKLAVDPNNADKVFVATPWNGVFVSTNAGVSWATVSQIPFGLNYTGNTIGSSTTSNNVSSGTHTFTVATAWYWNTGAKFLAWQTSNPTNQLSCVVTNAPVTSVTTTVNVPATSVRGSGTGVTDWTLGWDNGQGHEPGAPIITFVNSSLIYAGVYGVGVYKSIDGGTNWTIQNSANMPLQPGRILADRNGLVYVVNYSNLSLWKHVGGTTWTNISAVTGYAGGNFCINPNNELQIFIGGHNQWYYSTDGGVTWSLRMESAGTRTATDISYLATVEPFTVGQSVWGPDNIIYISDGVGVWKLLPADIPMASGIRPPVTSMSIGIEQLVVNWIQSRPSGLPLQLVCMDRAVFVITDQTKYPLTCKTQAIAYADATHTDINEGYSIDYASNDPTFSIALIGLGFTPYGTFFTVKSSDSGANWTRVTNPSGITASGGCIVALTSTNWLWVEANGWQSASSLGGRIYYTTNGGTNWAQITTPGLAVGDGFYGPPSNYSLRRQIAIADRVNGNFYLYNSGSVLPGIWRSTDGGANFARVCTTRLDGYAPGVQFQDQFSCQFRPLPPYSGYTGGEMYATAGIEDPGNPGSTLYECKDVGSSVTMTAIAGTSNVWCVGIGKEKPGNTYPTIFIYGIIDIAHDVAGIGGQGVWQSDNHCATWKKLTPTKFVNHSMDAIGTVEGDMNVYGKCYVGFFGNGMMVYTP